MIGGFLTSSMGRRGCDGIIVGFKTTNKCTYAITAYHH